MHKKLEAELVQLAHSILQIKENNNVLDLHKRARVLYEKLSVLKYVNESLTMDVPGEILADENNISEAITIAEDTEQPIILKETAANSEMEVIENEVMEDELPAFEKRKEEVQVEENSIPQFSLEKEFKDAISADEAMDFFEKATKENPVIQVKEEPQKKSLNDALVGKNLQIGLNDRIAFVKHLFDGSQEDFNRVLSQLNSFKTEKEAKNFVFKFVKPDYNWGGKEEYEDRLINLIERKFV